MAVPDSFQPLRTFLRAYTGIPEVILGFGEGKRIPLPYGTLHLTSSRPVNRPEQRHIYVDDNPSIDASEEPGVEWEFVWQFDVFGDGAEDVFAKLEAARFVPTALQTMRPYTIHETSLVRHLPAIIDNAYEERSNVDIVLRAVIHHQFYVDPISSIEDPDVTQIHA